MPAPWPADKSLRAGVPTSLSWYGRGGPGNSDKVLSYRPLRARILTHGQSDEEALQRGFQGEGSA